MRHQAETGPEQAPRLGLADGVERPHLVGRDAAAAQNRLEARHEQVARLHSLCLRGGLDPRPDREGGLGRELLVDDLDEQPLGHARMERRRDGDRADRGNRGVQGRAHGLRFAQETMIDLGIEHTASGLTRFDF